FTSSRRARRSAMFSPMVAIMCVSSSPMLRLLPGNGAVFKRSTSSPAPTAASVTPCTNFWKTSLRATKSVSLLISTSAPTLPRVTAPTRPSDARRPAFLAAAERPFLRSQSTAPSRSPSVWAKARLQSIMPAPVFSRSSLTSAAVISAMGSLFPSGFVSKERRLEPPPLLVVQRRAPQAGACASSEPASTLSCAGGGISSQLGPCADIGAAAGELGLEAVEHRARHQLAIEMDGAHRVVIAGDRIGNAVRRRVAVEDGDDRHLELVRLLDGDRFLVGVDDEQDVGQA